MHWNTGGMNWMMIKSKLNKSSITKILDISELILMGLEYEEV